MNLEHLSEFDFKIKEEFGIARFSLEPRDLDIKSVLFYSPYCVHCQEKLQELRKSAKESGELQKKIYAVNIIEAPLLATHFNITVVPTEIQF